jgi:membrane-associated protease RseP (regulator of RpoE activity)
MSETASPLPPGLELDHPHEVWIIKPPRRRLWVHIVLLLATFASTTLVGTHMQANFAAHQPAFAINDDVGAFLTSIWDRPSQLLQGLSFSLTLLLILMAHEMGHYLYAVHYRVYATLPYFIPFPSLIGTLGAFIRIKSPIPSRSALFDIGVAGPIAGFIPACIAVFSGLALSQPLAANVGLSDSQPGFPVFFNLAARVLHIGHPLSSLSLHPIGAAGWVGVFATSLNLLPGGQLDGGHIFYAAFPKLHRWVSLLTVFALLILTKYFSYVWLLWAVVLWLTSYHPPIPDRPGITAARKWIAALAVAILIVSFTPAPLTHTSGREVWPAIRDSARDSVRSLNQNVRHWLHRR